MVRTNYQLRPFFRIANTLNKSLNIAVNMRLLLPGRKEGIPRFILETTKRLVANNPNHKFYFFFDRDYDRDLVFGENVIPIVTGPKARHPWLWYWWFEQSLPRLFKKHKIDLFYSPEFYLSLKTKVPTLIVSHDIVFETFKDHLPAYQQKYLVKNVPLFHKRAEHIIAVSNFSKADIIDKYKIDEQKISVAGNACSDDFAPIDDLTKEQIKRKFSDSCPYLMYVGAIHPRKNVLRMIKAFEAFKKTNPSELKLLVIGRMAWKSKEVEQAIYETPDVIYLDKIENELHQIMPASEGLLFASLFEGFGIPILEGFKSQIPVISSDANAMSEIAGDAALLVDPLSIEEIATAIDQIVNNKVLRAQLIKKGIQRASNFNWESTAKHVEEKLFSLL